MDSYEVGTFHMPWECWGNCRYERCFQKNQII